MKNKILIGLLLILAMVFSMVSLVNAGNPGTVSITYPTANVDVSGSITFTGTSQYSGDGANWSISTNSGSTFTMFCLNDTTSPTTTWTCTNTTHVITSDARNLIINLTVYNNTGGVGQASDTNTGISFDNLNPTASLTLDKSFISKGHPIYADCSGSSDAIDTALTYLFTLTKPDTSTVTQQYSNSSTSRHTFSSSDVNILGSYSVTCQVWDNIGNTSTSSASTFDVRTTSKAGTEESTIEDTTTEKKSNLLLGFIIIVVIIGAVIVVLILTTPKPKGKKRRR